MDDSHGAKPQFPSSPMHFVAAGFISYSHPGSHMINHMLTQETKDTQKSIWDVHNKHLV